MKIKKVSQTTPTTAQVVNQDSNSTTDTYSCNKINEKVLDNYSTTEQVIGTWIDGKPIYRKTFNLTTTSGNTYIDKSLISNVLEYIVRIYGTTKQPSGNISCIPYFVENQDRTNIFYSKSSERIQITCGNSYGFGEAKIILEYTKTTDTGNS